MNNMNNLAIKKELSTQQTLNVQFEFEKKKKSKGTAYAFWWFTGGLGGHRFYMGDVKRGLAIVICHIVALTIFIRSTVALATGSDPGLSSNIFVAWLIWVVLGIIVLIDVFKIGKRVERVNEKIEAKIIGLVNGVNNENL